MASSSWLSLTAIIVSIFAAFFSCMQWRTAEKKRQNELFDRRYKFYLRIKEMCLNQHHSANRPVDIEDWLSCVDEASFLFGPDIAKHISSLPDKRLSGSPNFPEEWFVEPFKKYLKL